MIVRFSRNPFLQAWGIFKFNWISLLVFVGLSSTAALLCKLVDFHYLEIDVIPVTILGGALAIFLGFRNNSAYDMWWEARKIWGGVVNISRTWALESTSFVTDIHNPSDANDQEIAAMKKRLVYRHLAWINALRIQLRNQDAWEEVSVYLEPEEAEKLATYKNKATMMLQLQGQELMKARKAGYIDDFRHMQMEDRLKEMYDLQGKAERVKKTIFPYYYSYFTSLFMWLFIILLPFSLVHKLDWGVIPITTMVSFVFLMLNKAGSITEDPFEGRAADTPLTSLCRTIEIDMRQQLGEEELPPAMPNTVLPYGLEYVP